MKAYWIARAEVLDPEEYNKYATRVPAILARYGGRILARGGPHQILEGNAQYGRFVVIEFPDLASAAACHASDAYRAAAAFRRNGAGDVDIAIVEGVPD